MLEYFIIFLCLGENLSGVKRSLACLSELTEPTLMSIQNMAKYALRH